MDRTALRVERIRQNLDGKRFAIDLLARIHIAILAVSITVVATFAVAGLTRQLGAILAVLGMTPRQPSCWYSRCGRSGS